MNVNWEMHHIAYMLTAELVGACALTAHVEWDAEVQVLHGIRPVKCQLKSNRHFHPGLDYRPDRCLWVLNCEEPLKAQAVWPKTANGNLHIIMKVETILVYLPICI